MIRRKVSSIICDSDLWLRAKRAAAEAPMTLGEWIEDAMKEKLAKKTDFQKLAEQKWQPETE